MTGANEKLRYKT